jgi:hypothetical protein
MALRRLRSSILLRSWHCPTARGRELFGTLMLLMVAMVVMVMLLAVTAGY